MSKIKIGFALAIAVMVTGCASLGDISNKIVNNTDKAGVIYGFSGVGARDVTAKKYAMQLKTRTCAALMQMII